MQQISVVMEKGKTMTDMNVPTCGACIHADVCARVPYFTEFSRENPAYCKDFRENLTWIPVTERLPEKGVNVIALGSRGGVYTAQYKGSIYWHKLNARNHMCEPTHWMPLPNPPEENDNA